ncbi:hypothetical protein V6N13_139412 [Hibiscus sabdariffa]|uniref:Uncharacterized protein n=1 Tax=Hibiscus sabdariffa TaxID=183260 RepID=A0ABR2C873_9ROSI
MHFIFARLYKMSRLHDIHQAKAMASANVFCMNPRDKDISYADHSTLQRNILLKTMPILKDTIKDMLSKILPVTCIKVADLGCASGPNAFFPTYEIMDTIIRICQQSHCESPELQVFLNDLPYNDFNTVFRSVPDFKKDKGDLRGPCFIAGVPEEMIDGGRMLLSLTGRSIIDPTSNDCCFLWDLLTKSLIDLVDKGLVQESDVDSFNIPFYTPCKEEVMEIIEKEGSFNLHKMKVFEDNWDFEDNDHDTNFVFDKNKSGQNFAKTIRAGAEPMLASHFGEIIIDDLFTRYAYHVGEYLSREKTKYITIVVSMTMK